MTASAEQYMQAMRQQFRSEKARGLDVSYTLELTGEETGIWTIDVRDERCQIRAGAAGKADTKITMSFRSYRQLAAGKLDVVAAYQKGEVRVAGNTQLAIKFADLFAPWAALAEASDRPVPESPAPAPEPLRKPPLADEKRPTIADYVRAMPNRFRADRAGDLEATYRFELVGSNNRWTVSIANGQATVSRGESGSADVTIKMSDLDFIKLAQGQLNTTQAFRQGQIRVSGAIDLAAQITELFPAWAETVTTTSAPPDPASVPPTVPEPEPDPVALAPPAGEPITPSKPEPEPAAPAPAPPAADSPTDKYVRAMVTGFRADKAGDLDTEYEFHLTGEDGGIWTVVVHEGDCKAYKGRVFQSPKLEIEMSAADFIQLAHGRFDPKQAMQSGRLQIRGQVDDAAKITQVFSPWAGAVDSGSTPSFATPPAPFQPPAAVSTSAGPAYPTLVNGSFDHYQPYIRNGEEIFWREFPERYGAGWTLQIISEEKDRAAHLMDSGVFGKFAQKYFRGNGHDYHIQGRHSQVITGRYGFDLILYQTVAVEMGRAYEFGGSVVTFFKGPGTPPVYNKIFKTVGIDPTGGSDYRGDTVVWGERDGVDNKWRNPSLKIRAQTDAITVFIRIENTERDVGQTNLNTIHLENFKLK